MNARKGPGSSAQGYSIRMDDGSEVGPMDVETVEAWFRQGLVRHDSPVRRADVLIWRPLSEVLAKDLKKPAAPPKKAAAPTPRPSPPAKRPKPPAAPRQRAGSGAGLLKGLAAVLAVAAVAGAGFFAYKTFLQESEQSRLVRRFSSETTAEPASGFRLPEGWVALRNEQTLFAAPADARLSFAQATGGALGFVVSEAAAASGADLDGYLDALLARRRRDESSYTEDARREATLGGLPGRETSARWEQRGERRRERVLVWKDGWNHNAVVAWAPESEPAATLTALAAGVPQGGVVAGRRAQAIEAVTSAAPQLSPAAAELLMARSGAQILEPREAFRRGQSLAVRGLPSLSQAEQREVGGLIQSVYAALGARERSRLAAYLEKLRARRPTTPEEDEAMSVAMKSSVLKLSRARRARLQALFEKALRAALASGG